MTFKMVHKINYKIKMVFKIKLYKKIKNKKIQLKINQIVVLMMINLKLKMNQFMIINKKIKMLHNKLKKQANN